MPIPTPLPKEQNNEFIQRCMMDDTMSREYKDIDQRYAICREQLTKHEVNANNQSKDIRGKK
jgi:hypothetical protein